MLLIVWKLILEQGFFSGTTVLIKWSLNVCSTSLFYVWIRNTDICILLTRKFFPLCYFSWVQISGLTTGHLVFLVDLITTPFLNDLQWSLIYRAGYRLVVSERFPTHFQVTLLLFWYLHTINQEIFSTVLFFAVYRLDLTLCCFNFASLNFQ
jgi:hypothetical protein